MKQIIINLIIAIIAGLIFWWFIRMVNQEAKKFKKGKKMSAFDKIAQGKIG